MHLDLIRSRNHQKEQERPIAWHASLALAVTGGLSVLIYAFIFARLAYLPALYNVPLLTGHAIALRDLDKGLGLVRAELILSFVALGILYYLGWKAAHYARGWSNWAIVLTFALAFGIALLFMYPFGAADIYDNITHGRILALYHGNPFLNKAAQYPNDPFLPYTAWKNDVSAYGPLWELAAGLAIKIVGNDMYWSILAFKILPAIFWVLSIGVIGLILRRRGTQTALPAMLLFAWNPLVLYEVWSNGHNDMMMAFFILLAAWLVLEKRYTLAVVSLVAGTLVKYIPILLVPLVGMIALRDLPNNKRRAVFIVSAAALSVALIVISFAPFWVGIDTLSIGRREGMLSGTLASAVWSALVDGSLHLPKDATAHLITRISGILTAGFATFQAIYASRKPNFDGYIQGAFNVLMFYLLVTVPWFQQWYAIWIVVLLPFLAPMARSLALVFAFSVLGKQLWVDPNLYWAKVWSPLPNREIGFAIADLIVPWLYTAYVLHILWQEQWLPAIRSYRLRLLEPRGYPGFRGLPVTGRPAGKEPLPVENDEQQPESLQRKS